MTETEGVIKYTLDHISTVIDKDISITEINRWRTLLFKLQLIGQVKERYDGYGFGNISQRINPIHSTTDQFIISGTQTGGIEILTRQHYSHVLTAQPNKNYINSVGETKPSSEALTHASVYQQDKTIQAVIHIHSPEIWNNTEQLKLAHTPASIAYGTPAMAKEVEKLMCTEQLIKERIFSLLGHKDGIIAFADDLETAAMIIIRQFSKAIQS